MKIISIKKIVPVFLFSICSFNANAYMENISFPYSQFKETDFENNLLNKSFENFILEIERKDMEYKSMTEEYNNNYLSKLNKENTKGAYRDEFSQSKIIYELNYKEQKNIKTVREFFYVKELNSFNNFIKEIKANTTITSEQKEVLIDSLKKLYKAYADFSVNYDYLVKTSDRFCSVNPSTLDDTFDYSYSNEFCNDLYNNFNEEFVLNLKNYTKYGINDFINGYVGFINQGTFVKDLNAKIEAYRRNKEINK